MLHSIQLGKSEYPTSYLKKSTTEWHLELNVQLKYVYACRINASIQFSKICSLDKPFAAMALSLQILFAFKMTWKHNDAEYHWFLSVRWHFLTSPHKISELRLSVNNDLNLCLILKQKYQMTSKDLEHNAQAIWTTFIVPFLELDRLYMVTNKKSPFVFHIEKKGILL